jgi:hypothetical protein
MEQAQVGAIAAQEKFGCLQGQPSKSQATYGTKRAESAQVNNPVSK